MSGGWRWVHPVQAGRWGLVAGAMALLALALITRVAVLQVGEGEFLRSQGNQRHVRIEAIEAHRGIIRDRHGEPLAVSTPVDAVVADPRRFIEARARWGELEAALGLPAGRVAERVLPHKSRQFAYIARGVTPDVSARALALKLPGVQLRRQYRRYYPTAEVAAHVVGFTDIDDIGREGIELSFEHSLRGESGRQRVLRDHDGHRIEVLETLAPAQPGRDVVLSIDKRLQYVAHRALKRALRTHRAAAGSAVLIDVHSGEVLALANLPTYNPNLLEDRKPPRTRNRALTDPFEPGSTLKPFTVAVALERHLIGAEATVDTAPGWYRLGRHRVRDHRNYGLLSVTDILKKSSNVGVSRIGLELEPERFERYLRGFGFGQPTALGLPGEDGGTLEAAAEWSRIRHANITFGYGLSATVLQLAGAYATLGNDGHRVTPRILRSGKAAEIGDAVVSPGTARTVVRMLEEVVGPTGTASRAAVAHYSVAGKTGTTHTAEDGSYDRKRYSGSFVGLLPARDPQLALAVVIHHPQGKAYYGGLVAAPVFAEIMDSAVRLLGIAPDNLQLAGSTPDGGPG